MIGFLIATVTAGVKAFGLATVLLGVLIGGSCAAIYLVNKLIDAVSTAGKEGK